MKTTKIAQPTNLYPETVLISHLKTKRKIRNCFGKTSLHQCYWFHLADASKPIFLAISMILFDWTQNRARALQTPCRSIIIISIIIWFGLRRRHFVGHNCNLNYSLHSLHYIIFIQFSIFSVRCVIQHQFHSILCECTYMNGQLAYMNVQMIIIKIWLWVTQTEWISKEEEKNVCVGKIALIFIDLHKKCAHTHIHQTLSSAMPF